VKRLASLALLCALVCHAPAIVRADAAVEGTVALPPEAIVPVSTPRYPLAASYTIGSPDPPAAVVYLEGVFPAPPPGRARVAQQHYQFAPGLVPVRRGTAVAFPNLDDEYHSVFSYSRAKRFDLGRYQRDETPAEIVFDQPGVVKLYCEIHDHMRGTILVLDTPYFAKTDAAGRYRLEHLPAGRHVLRAWLDEETVLARPVELRDGRTVQVDFAAPESAP
jgi:hypothetical protein